MIRAIAPLCQVGMVSAGSMLLKTGPLQTSCFPRNSSHCGDEDRIGIVALGPVKTDRSGWGNLVPKGSPILPPDIERRTL